MDQALAALVAQARADLRRQGYTVLTGLLAAEELEELRLEADTLFELGQEEQARGGAAAAGAARWGAHAAESCVYEALPGHRCTPELRSSYGAYRRHRCAWPLRPAGWRLVFDSRLGRLAAALLGPAATLVNEQHLIKAPGSALSAFAWHRDSDWLPAAGVAARHPYLSVWCALDDMTRDNGCLVVLPGSHVAPPDGSAPAPPAQAAARGEAAQQPEALALEVPAGTAVLTSDTLLHCSGPNASPHMRRAWMPQFAAAPLLRADGCPASLAIPLQPPATLSACNG